MEDIECMNDSVAEMTTAFGGVLKHLEGIQGTKRDPELMLETARLLEERKTGVRGFLESECVGRCALLLKDIMPPSSEESRIKSEMKFSSSIKRVVLEKMLGSENILHGGTEIKNLGRLMKIIWNVGEVMMKKSSLGDGSPLRIFREMKAGVVGEITVANALMRMGMHVELPLDEDLDRNAGVDLMVFTDEDSFLDGDPPIFLVDVKCKIAREQTDMQAAKSGELGVRGYRINDDERRRRYEARIRGACNIPEEQRLPPHVVVEYPSFLDAVKNQQYYTNADVGVASSRGVDELYGLLTNYLATRNIQISPGTVSSMEKL